MTNAITTTLYDQDYFDSFLKNLEAKGYRTFRAKSNSRGMCIAHILDSTDSRDTYYCKQKVGFLGLKEEYIVAYCKTQYDPIQLIMAEAKSNTQKIKNNNKNV